tara:strand:- start:51 stop:359 length:309 start_codon:yes stop_codon:yes gene_type:complete
VIKIATNRPIKYRICDIGANGKEFNIRGDMGAFSEIDIELTYGTKPTTTPRVGSFGVCLNDPNNPPRFLTLLQIIGSVGLFAPVDDPGMTLQFDVGDYWQLT